MALGYNQWLMAKELWILLFLKIFCSYTILNKNDLQIFSQFFGFLLAMGHLTSNFNPTASKFNKTFLKVKYRNLVDFYIRFLSRYLQEYFMRKIYERINTVSL